MAIADRSVVLIDVDDGSGAAPLPGSTNFEEAARTPVTGSLPETSPDDLYMVCTGGTTGRPKAVLWRQADIYVSAMAGVEDATVETIVEAATSGAGSGRPWYPVAPLMHAAAQWTAFSGLNQGAAVVVHEDSGPFSAQTVLELAEREQVALMSIVGDAYAVPIVEELRRRPYDLSSLFILGTGGAATGEQHTEALLDILPNVVVLDGYGASETGGMAFGARTKGKKSEGFVPSAGATVISEDRSRFLQPGDSEVGWTARRGRVPLGYLHDREKTERTFPIIDGERVTLPGDRAQLSAEGRILLLGRDSLVVNTGGEKVFVEEVEDVVRRHPDVADALVVGRPSDRFGQEVVAVVAPAEGATSGSTQHPRVCGGGDRPFQGSAGCRRRRARPPPRQREARLRLGQGGRADGGGCDRRQRRALVDLGVRGRGYLIVGGSAGMGKAAAQALASEGALVAIAGRGRDRAVAAATELSATSEEPVVALSTDLTKPGAGRDGRAPGL